MHEPEVSFEAFVEQKTRDASAAHICTLATVMEQFEAAVTRIGNRWTRAHYDGDFPLVDAATDRTSLSLAFVQSPAGNTAAADPGTFGGGETDKHLLYEGLSRVAADAVLVGARTLDPTTFFSIWHPEIVALRRDLGLARHPAQIVVSRRGHFDVTSLLFNVPDVPLFLIGGEECLVRHARALRERPWVLPIAWLGVDLTAPIERLRREHGIRRISAVGGRLTATQLVDDRLAQDVYLTTGSREGGAANTPWYAGTAPPSLAVTTRKEWTDAGSRLIFEHALIR
jgi:riboflavin biosynthesis pyrimidine reductase